MEPMLLGPYCTRLFGPRPCCTMTPPERDPLFLPTLMAALEAAIHPGARLPRREELFALATLPRWMALPSPAMTE